MWTFVKNQIFGMEWLHILFENMLTAFGLDVQSKLGGSILFFLFDVTKISVLLFVLIFLISYIQSYFPPERSKKIMTRFNGITTQIVAALLGTITPFCSCSSIPIFMGFTAAGLPLGVTFSFLISSPMVDLGSLVLLMSIFGWKIAVSYVVLGLLIAVIGGSVIKHLHMEDQIVEVVCCKKTCCCGKSDKKAESRVKTAFRSVLSTLKKVFPYILAGVAIGAIIHNWIPEDWIVSILGEKNPFGVVLATIFGITMYADIFACIPIVESLLAKGALLGVVMSFLMAVTALSLPSIIMLRKTVKPKLLAVFVGICTVGILISGFFFNLFQKILI